MKSKLLYLVQVSLKRKISTKWFVIANFVLAILIIGLINIDSVINMFGGNFNAKTIIHVIDNANVYDIFLNQMESSQITIYGNEESNYVIDTSSSVSVSKSSA